MTTTYGVSWYCAVPMTLLRSPLLASDMSLRSPPYWDHRRSRINDVHLVPCHPPVGELDGAPRSSLSENSASESWDGFWSEERYYTRCTRADGSVQWYRVADERNTFTARSFTARVLPLRPGNRRMLLVGSRDRAILIGTSKRRARRATAAAGDAR